MTKTNFWRWGKILSLIVMTNVVTAGVFISLGNRAVEDAYVKQAVRHGATYVGLYSSLGAEPPGFWFQENRKTLADMIAVELGMLQIFQPRLETLPSGGIEMLCLLQGELGEVVLADATGHDQVQVSIKEELHTYLDSVGPQVDQVVNARSKHALQPDNPCILTENPWLNSRVGPQN